CISERLAQAEEAYGKALEILEKLARECPTVSKYQNALAYSNMTLANLYWDKGRLDQAERCLRKAIDASQRVGDDSHCPEYQGILALNYGGLAELYTVTFLPLAE